MLFTIVAYSAVAFILHFKLNLSFLASHVEDEEEVVESNGIEHAVPWTLLMRTTCDSVGQLNSWVIQSHC